ncbi:thiol reductant ABC exporter subunit CydC [Nonomuraea sp. CA-218870]|uniref:thiol reductant ABC exporter subunit CydC n=1 Tax=Nonomuraea sp. CA-218870 TaxID=3239998 RepID=UPI003D8F38F7
MTATTIAPAARPRGSRFGPLLALLGPHRPLLLIATASGIAHHLVVLASAGAGAWVVSSAITGATADDLRPGLVLLGLLLPLLALTPWLESYLAHMAAFRVLADVRGRVYAAFERLAPGYLLQRRSGDLGSTAISDVEQLELWFAHTLSPLISAVTVPVAALTALGVFHPALAAALAPALILLALLPARLRRRAAAQGARLRTELGELNAEAVDTLQGLRELLTSGAGPRQLDRLRERDDRLLRARLAHGRRSGLEHAVTNAATTLGLLAVLVTAALLVAAGSLEPAFFPVAVVLAAATFAPVVAVTDVARDINLVTAAGDRIMTILNTPAPVTDQVTAPPPGPVEARVRFDEVRFRYAPGLPEALAGVTFELAPGETVALVGRSGAGKSTCASLLMRMWDVTAGAVTVGGHDVRAFPQEDLRRLITLVPQDVHLFDVSLRDNIRLGRPEATHDDVEAAARAAHAHDFITALPDGYDTLPGELGARLSGGQRQRIAIARALLKDAPILVMDEAVSNLDAESEQEVAAAMAAARHDRTTLVIAHRLSTIRTADRVVVLEDGRVAESGAHAELLARSGPYTRLLATQLGGPVSGAAPSAP